MKILVIGSGGREHALDHHFRLHHHETFWTPGNGATLSTTTPSVQLSEPSTILEAAQALQPDLAVIGPEQPLALGVADLLQKAGFRVFGPTRKGCLLESSKAYAKDFMRKWAIPTARYLATRDPHEAYTSAARFCQNSGGVVIKPSGLTAGKGVTVCHEYQEACQAITDMLEHAVYGEAGQELVVEERLTGPEISILALSDGKTMVPLLPAQDHKAAYDGDEGPNTGGMGAYAPTPFATQEVMDFFQTQILEPTCRGLIQEGIQYVGVLYFGLMLTPQGPKVLEFNCRFGDPETQAIVPLLDCDLAQIMVACTEGTLTPNALRWTSQSAACVVCAAEGYPGHYDRGHPIWFPEERENVLIFHAGTLRNSDGQIVTNGGRVLAVTGLGQDLVEALERAYGAIGHLHFEGMQYRRDIGHRACALLTAASR